MSDRAWYVAINNQQSGPMTIDELILQLSAGGGRAALVWGPGLQEWSVAGAVPEIASRLDMQGPASGSRPPPPPPLKDLAYEIEGDDMQFVEIFLEPGQTVLAEPGAMMFMTAGVRMETVFGDPSAREGGFFDKVLSAGKRVFTGESLFISQFQNVGNRRETIAFAAPYPGKIIPMPLAQLGGELIVQKDAFLCAALGVQIGIAFQRKIGVALFGGEGFIMQRLTGNGLAMVHSGGTVTKKTLSPGETLRLDTGCLVALIPSVRYDIQFTGGFKNTLFGGEGLFLATLTGPGDVWLQSLPFSRLAARMMSGRSGREEGNILGGLGLGTLLGGND